MLKKYIEARERLVKQAIKAMESRQSPAYKGAWMCADKQTILQGYWCVQFNDVVEGLPVCEGISPEQLKKLVDQSTRGLYFYALFDFDKFLNSMKGLKEKTVNDTFALIGTRHFNAFALADILKAFDSPILQVTSTTYSAMKIEAKNGNGILCPVRVLPDEGKNIKVVYTCEIL